MELAAFTFYGGLVTGTILFIAFSITCSFYREKQELPEAPCQAQAPGAARWDPGESSGPRPCQVALVEVRSGESQEEAWRRHLLSHPWSAAAQVKIFHFVAQSGKPSRLAET
jgi:hypothetical protein